MRLHFYYSSPNHIRATKTTYYYAKRKRIQEYYTITPSGIRYLAENCGEIIPWINFVPNNITKIKIRSKRNNINSIERFLKISTASMFADSIGAKTNPVFFLGNDDYIQNSIDKEKNTSSYSLDVLVTTAIKKYEEAQEQFNNRKIKEKNDIYFYSSSEIKSKLTEILHTGNETIDINSCRYSGLLESCYQSVIIYTGSTFGMSWQNKFVKKEITTHTAFSKKLSVYKKVSFNNNRAALLVTNAKMFADTYFDKNNKQTEKEDKLGTGFTHFYVFPINSDGKNQFKHLMETNTEEERKALIAATEHSELFQTNNDYFAKEMFPIKTKTNIPIFIGNYIDILQINKLMGFITKFPDLELGVLCYVWQIDYYSRVLQPLKFYTISSKRDCD